MPTSSPNTLFRSEKDSLVFLGLLARAYLSFDPPIPLPASEPFAPTHFAGLNIHACVVDNGTGQLLAVEQNRIHRDQNPLQHAEQLAVRAAMARRLAGSPRPSSVTVEAFYIHHMFTSAGSGESAFLRTGATCYSTLEPCPMCASTLLVSRMKRVAFVFKDVKYGGAWPDLKHMYYPKDSGKYGQLKLTAHSKLTAAADKLNRALQLKATNLRARKVPDTHLLDHCRPVLFAAFNLLRNSTVRDLTTHGDDLARDERTLRELKEICNLPG